MEKNKAKKDGGSVICGRVYHFSTDRKNLIDKVPFSKQLIWTKRIEILEEQ